MRGQAQAQRAAMRSRAKLGGAGPSRRRAPQDGPGGVGCGPEGSWMSATPLPASTVILLRDGPRSPEVLLLERHAKSEFLPDMYVFPGGRVDDDDLALGERAGISEAQARTALPSVAPE